jgi:hypothetical protein
MEEVEFWQGKYEEAMKTIRKIKHRYPHDLETLSDEETEEFSPQSPPHKLATHAVFLLSYSVRNKRISS